MRSNRNPTLTVIAFACLVLSVAFSNCSRLGVSGSPSSTGATTTVATTTGSAAQSGNDGGSVTGSAPASGGTGNGQGYDGKITFVDYLSGSAQCTEGGNINAKILIDEATSVATIVRDHCQDMTPVTLVSSSYSRLAYSPDVLIYDGRAFQKSTGLPPAPTDFTMQYVCRASGANPLQIVISADGSGLLRADASATNFESGNYVATASGAIPSLWYTGTDAAGDIIKVEVQSQNTSGSYGAQLQIQYGSATGPISATTGTCFSR